MLYNGPLLCGFNAAIKGLTSRKHHLEQREVEHPEHGEHDAVALVSRHHGNEGQQGASETEEVHAGLDVEANSRQ